MDTLANTTIKRGNFLFLEKQPKIAKLSLSFSLLLLLLFSNNTQHYTHGDNGKPYLQNVSQEKLCESNNNDNNAQEDRRKQKSSTCCCSTSVLWFCSNFPFFWIFSFKKWCTCSNPALLSVVPLVVADIGEPSTKHGRSEPPFTRSDLINPGYVESGKGEPMGIGQWNDKIQKRKKICFYLLLLLLLLRLMFWAQQIVDSFDRIKSNQRNFNENSILKERERMFEVFFVSKKKKQTQSAIAPFHNPGNSWAFKSRPFKD